MDRPAFAYMSEPNPKYDRFTISTMQPLLVL